MVYCRFGCIAVDERHQMKPPLAFSDAFLKSIQSDVVINTVLFLLRNTFPSHTRDLLTVSNTDIHYLHYLFSYKCDVQRLHNNSKPCKDLWGELNVRRASSGFGGLQMTNTETSAGVFIITWSNIPSFHSHSTLLIQRGTIIQYILIWMFVWGWLLMTEALTFSLSVRAERVLVWDLMAEVCVDHLLLSVQLWMLLCWSSVEHMFTIRTQSS